jgi:hypothetical protein
MPNGPLFGQGNGCEPIDNQRSASRDDYQRIGIKSAIGCRKTFGDPLQLCVKIGHVVLCSEP